MHARKRRSLIPRVGGLEERICLSGSGTPSLPPGDTAPPGPTPPPGDVNPTPPSPGTNSTNTTSGS